MHQWKEVAPGLARMLGQAKESMLGVPSGFRHVWDVACKRTPQHPMLCTLQLLKPHVFYIHIRQLKCVRAHHASRTAIVVVLHRIYQLLRRGRVFPTQTLEKPLGQGGGLHFLARRIPLPRGSSLGG